MLLCICSTVFFPFTAKNTRYSCPLLLSDQIDNTNYFSSKKKVDSDCPKVRKLDSEKKMVCFKLFIFDTLRALKLTTTKMVVRLPLKLNFDNVIRLTLEHKNNLKILF